MSLRNSKQLVFLQLFWIRHTVPQKVSEFPFGIVIPKSESKGKRRGQTYLKTIYPPPQKLKKKQCQRSPRNPKLLPNLTYGTLGTYARFRVLFTRGIEEKIHYFNFLRLLPAYYTCYLTQNLLVKYLVAYMVMKSLDVVSMYFQAKSRAMCLSMLNILQYFFSVGRFGELVCTTF